jgi:hypothetical protein
MVVLALGKSTLKQMGPSGTWESAMAKVHKDVAQWAGRIAARRNQLHTSTPPNLPAAMLSHQSLFHMAKRQFQFPQLSAGSSASLLGLGGLPGLSICFGAASASSL